VAKVRDFLRGPIVAPALRPLLLHFMNLETETIPEMDVDANLRIVYFFIKLVLMGTLFIDRDYSDKYDLCTIPSAQEEFYADLIPLFRPLPCRHLSIYGALFPSIQTAVFSAALNLSSIILSHINITNEIIVSIGNNCKNLVELRLQHVLLWTNLSIDSFCEAFFEGSSRSLILSLMKEHREQEVKLSLPKLKILELMYGDNIIAEDYHLFILTFYINVSLEYSDWKSDYFAPGLYSTYFMNVIRKCLHNSRTLSISTLIITSRDLATVDNKYLDRLESHIPFLKKLIVSFDRNLDKERVSSSLIGLISRNQSIRSLYADVGAVPAVAVNAMQPFLLNRPDILTELTIETEDQDSGYLLYSIRDLLLLCKSLSVFRLKVKSSRDLDKKPPSNLLFPIRESLREIWVQELSTSIVQTPINSNDYCNRLDVLNCFLSAAPNLETFSFSVSEDMSSVLDTLGGRCRRLHVLIHEGHAWRPSPHQIDRLISNHRNLEELYLEDIQAQDLGPLILKYANTRLIIRFGTLDNWTRS